MTHDTDTGDDGLGVDYKRSSVDVRKADLHGMRLPQRFQGHFFRECLGGSGEPSPLALVF